MREYSKYIFKMGDISDSPYSSNFESSRSRASSVVEIQGDLFDKLFESLEKGLTESPINVQRNPVTRMEAVGKFLSQVNYSRTNMKAKIRQDYQDRINKLRSDANAKSMRLSKDLNERSEKFVEYLQSLLTKAHLESLLIRNKTRKDYENTMAQIKDWVFTAITELEKEVRLARLNISTSVQGNVIKSQELKDDFLWKRFLAKLELKAAGRARMSEPNSNAKSELKKLLESHFDAKVVIKNVVSLEDFEYSDVSSTRMKLQQPSSYERKTIISNICIIYLDKHSKSLPKLISKFLRLKEDESGPDLKATVSLISSLSTDKSLKSTFPLNTLLSRICNIYLAIESIKNPDWEPHNMLIFYNPDLARNITEAYISKETLHFEEDVVPFTSTRYEISQFILERTQASFIVNGQSVVLKAATLKELLQSTKLHQFPSDFLKALYEKYSIPMQNIHTFYVLDKPSFYNLEKPSKHNQLFIRSLTGISSI